MKQQILIEPSRNYTHRVRRVTVAIFLFFLLYIVLLGIGGIILAASLFAGIALILLFNWFAVLLGIGLILLGLMFFAFLVKFLFASYKSEDLYRVEVSADEYPRLFTLIREVADAVGMPMPRKVFLTTNVNAGVFYNSSFWSLFFPVRKNLEIGLGLIGSLTEDEFKAILAHEFGHFSQRSMRLGSYVYTVNRVIYNLVYGYDRWDEWLERWRQAGNMTSLLGSLTGGLVKGVRAILRVAYSRINMENSGLSREMEFQADEYAARLVGKEVTISALRRINFSSSLFDGLLSTCMSEAESEKCIQENLYENQRLFMDRICVNSQIEKKNGLPVMSDEMMQAHTLKTRVEVKDLWASHPTFTDREKSIRAVKSPEIPDTEKSAWELFDDPLRVQQDMTRRFFQAALQDTNDYTVMTPAGFMQKMQVGDEDQISGLFNGFYEGRYLSDVADEQVDCGNEPSVEEFHRVYSLQHKALFEQMDCIGIDQSTLEQIQDKSQKIKFFEFDGTRYRRKKAGHFMDQLNREKEELKKKVEELDRKAFRFNCRVVCRVSPEEKRLYIQKYRELIHWQQGFPGYDVLAGKLFPFYTTAVTKRTWTADEWQKFLRELSDFQGEFRIYLKEFFAGIEDRNEQADELLADKKSFWEIQFDWDIFAKYIQQVSDVKSWMTEKEWEKRKELTDFQLEMYRAAGLDIAIKQESD